MYYAMPQIESAGMQILLTVHDEIICEVTDTEQFTPTLLSGIMGTNNQWSQGLPLAAAGFQTYRYSKG
jgi:DNA polymerase